MGLFNNEDSGEDFNMLDYVNSKKHEKEDAKPAVLQQESPPAASDNSKDLEALRKEILDLRQENQTVKGSLERQSGTLQAYLQQQTQQRPAQQQEEFPTMEIKDPELAAALNALKAHTDKQLANFRNQNEAQRQQERAQGNAERFNSAVKQMRDTNPEFSKLFTDDQLGKWASPYLNSPQHQNIDWKNELELVTKTAHYDVLKTELAAAQRTLAEVNKRKESVQEQQKRDLKLVPGLGQRGGGGSSGGVSHGDQILRSYKGKSRMTYDQFGSELMKRIGG